jgi:putative ABC transport system ATP-binding protein
MKSLICRNVKKDYYLGEVVVQGLKGVSLEVDRGEFVCIAGPSGSGKTTMLNLIGCVDTPTSGIVEVAGQTTNNLNENQLTEIRLHKIGFIFQTFNLIKVLNVYENVEFPLLLIKNLSKKERDERIKYFLDEVGLYDRMNHKPNELSGGQRQRVAIARALVTKPEIILADEPTANLDSKTGENILNLMQKINQVDKTTFIFSTHDYEIMRIASKVVRLKDGLIVNIETSNETSNKIIEKEVY